MKMQRKILQWMTSLFLLFSIVPSQLFFMGSEVATAQDSVSVVEGSEHKGQDVDHEKQDQSGGENKVDNFSNSLTDKLEFGSEIAALPYRLGSPLAKLQSQEKSEDPTTDPDDQPEQPVAILDLYQSLKDKKEKLFNDEIKAKITDKDTIKVYEELKLRVEKFLEATKDFTEEALETQRKTIISLMNEMLALEKLVPRILSDEELALEKALRDAKNELGIMEAKDPADQEVVDRISRFEKLAVEIENATKTVGQSLEEGKTIASLQVELDQLVEALRKDIKEGKIDFKYTDAENGVDVKVFLQDKYGYVEQSLEENSYYLPQQTPVNLLVQFANNYDGNFTITLDVNDDQKITSYTGVGSIFLAGKNYAFELNENGQYEATIPNAPKGISEFVLKLGGLFGEYGQKYSLTISGDREGNVAAKELEFIITRSPYEDKAEIGGIGDYDDNKKNYPVIDAGPKGDQGTIIDEEAKEKEFWVSLFKAYGWLDEVLRNGDRDPIDLSYLEITVDLPEHAGNYAKYLYKKGFQFEEITDENGQVTQLKLIAKVKDIQEIHQIDDEGNVSYVFTDNEGNKVSEIIGKVAKEEESQILGENELFKDDKGNYYDQLGNQVFPKEFMYGENHYVISNDKILKVIPGEKEGALATLEPLTKEKAKNTFSEIIDNQKVYFEIRKKEIFKYTEKQKVTKGQGVNKDEQADANLQKVEGMIITIDGKYFGGKILTAEGTAIFDENGKFIGMNDGRYITDQNVLIGEDGKALAEPATDEEINNAKEINGQLFIERVIDQEVATYELLTTAIFDADGNLQRDYTYSTENNKVYDETGTEVGELGNEFTLRENVLLDEEGNALAEPATAEEVKAAQEAGVTTVERVIHQETALIKLVKNAVFDANGYILSGYSFHENLAEKAVVDKFGKKLDFVASFDEPTQKWTLRDLTDDSKIQKEQLTFADQTVYVGTSNEIVAGDQLEVVEEYFYFNGNKFVSVPSAEVKNNIWYKELAIANLTDNLVDKNIVNRGAGDLYQLQGSYYKKVGDYFVKIKGEGGPIYIAQKPGTIVYQELMNGDKKYVPGTSIFDILKDTKFALTFGGFKPGLDFVYSLIAAVKAEYVDLEDNQPKSIFSDDGIKHLIKKFTLKDGKEEELLFKKERPEEFEKNQAMNFELFNLLYRSKDDTIRDQILVDMWKNEKDHKKVVNFLAFLTKEYQKFFGNQYELVIHNDQLQVKFKNAEGIDQYADPVRSLIWKLSIYNNSERPYPEDASNKIVIEDSLMDNRMVYYEIIVNHQATYEAIGQALEEEKANLKEGEPDPVDPRDKNLFFLQDIDTIYLGVNPYFKDKAFVRVDGFDVTSEAILTAINAMTGTETTTELKLESGVKLLVFLDKATGQVHLKVKDAFYDVVNGTSPVQKAYNEQLAALRNVISEATTAEEIEKELQKLFGKDFKLANLQINENTSEDSETNNGTADQVDLETLKTFLIERIDSLSLATHPRGDEYATKDGRFNALQIVLEKGAQVGGLVTNATQEIQISSVLANHVDVPFTNEFGEVLDNYEMYYHAELDKIAKEQGKALAKMTEAEYQNAIKQAHKNVHERIASEGEDHIEIKPLVTYVDQKLSDGTTYKVYEAVAGNTLEYSDLEAVEEKVKGSINPYYVGGKTLKELGITDEDLLTQKIDLLSYYKHELGYDGRYFENKGRMYLDGSEQAPSVFEGSDNTGSITRPIGVVPIITPSDSADGGQEAGEDNEVDAKDAEAEITISQIETTGGGTEDKPKVDKTGDKTIVDLGEEGNNRIDFTVDTTIDFKKYDEKVLEEILASNGEKTKAEVEQELRNQGYNKDTGYKEINGGFIIDLLPDEVEIDENSSIQFIVHDTFEANGANQGQKAMFEENVKVLYIDNLQRYFEQLDQEAHPLLYKYLEQILTAGKVAYGNGNNFLINKIQHAILVLLPDFEAPYQKGSKSPVFTLKLSNFKISEDGKEMMRENYGAFESSSWSGYDTHKYRVQKPKTGNVDKYLRIYDEQGNVVKDVEEWFKGKVTLNFGDSFDYKLKFQQDSTTDTSGQGGFGNLIYDYQLEDYLPQVGEGKFKPILRGPVEITEGFTVKYFDVNGNEIVDLENNYQKVAFIRIIAPQKMDPTIGFEAIIPMKIPELQVEFEDGVAHLNGDEYFDMESVFNNESMIAENQAGDSNTVTIEVRPKEQLIIKKYWGKDGEVITDEKELANLNAKFQIVREYTDQNGQTISEVIKIVELNAENNFQMIIKDLPQKFVQVDVNEDGTIVKTEMEYTYKVEEVEQEGWEVEEVVMEGNMAKVFVNQKIIPDKPNKPNEPDEPHKPSEPNEPENPEQPTTPETPDKDQPTHDKTKVDQSAVLPHTGLQEQISMMILALAMILVGWMLITIPSKE